MTPNPQRYDSAMIPVDVLQQDPSQVLVAVKGMIENRGGLGDVIVLLVPQGAGSDTSRFIIRELEQRPGPGLPGGLGL